MEVGVCPRKGRKVRFRVQCFDDSGLIGEGFHERAVIETDQFMARLRDKAGSQQNV